MRGGVFWIQFRSNALKDKLSGVNCEVWGSADPLKKVKKDFCDSGERVLDLTFIGMMWDEYKLLSTADNSVPISPSGG